VQTVPFRPRARLRPLAAVALTGFALSLAVHALTYAGVVVPERVPGVWLLHLGIFVVFGPLIFSMQRWQGGRRFEWRELAPYFPRWVRIAVPALMAYAMVNFFLARHHLPERDRSTPYRSLTPEEQLYRARGFSGHWLVFYGIPALFFLYVPRGARRRGDDGVPR